MKNEKLEISLAIFDTVLLVVALQQAFIKLSNANNTSSLCAHKDRLHSTAKTPVSADGKQETVMCLDSGVFVCVRCLKTVKGLDHFRKHRKSCRPSAAAPDMSVDEWNQEDIRACLQASQPQPSTDLDSRTLPLMETELRVGLLLRRMDVNQLLADRDNTNRLKSIERAVYCYIRFSLDTMCGSHSVTRYAVMGDWQQIAVLIIATVAAVDTDYRLPSPQELGHAVVDLIYMLRCYVFNQRAEIQTSVSIENALMA